MTKSVHTPGPWRVSNFGDHLVVVSMETGAHIGGMGWAETTDRTLADARLIAAAPDLLEAVKSARDPNAAPEVSRRLADAALAKTEGRLK